MLLCKRGGDSMPRISTSVDENEHYQLKKIALEQGTSVQNIVHQLIKKYLEKQIKAEKTSN